jgi:hypothetical protein
MKSQKIIPNPKLSTLKRVAVWENIIVMDFQATRHWRKYISKVRDVEKIPEQAVEMILNGEEKFTINSKDAGVAQRL